MLGRLGQGVLTDMLASARKTVADEKRPAPERAEAARTLGLAGFAEAHDSLKGLLGGQAPQAVQLAAVETLGRFPDLGAGAALVSAWRGFSPKVRAAAGEVIFSRPQWAAAFLDAVEKKTIPAADIEPARLKLLQAHADAAVRERAGRVAKLVNVRPRQDVLEAYKPALRMKGDAARGKAVFKRTCAACHRVEGVGQEIAPNLAAMQG